MLILAFNLVPRLVAISSTRLNEPKDPVSGCGKIIAIINARASVMRATYRS